MYDKGMNVICMRENTCCFGCLILCRRRFFRTVPEDKGMGLDDIEDVSSEQSLKTKGWGLMISSQ